MSRWKRGIWVCAVLVLADAVIFGVHLFDTHVKYLVGVSQGWSAPFEVYALPVFVGHGFVLLLLLTAGIFCWKKAQGENGQKQ